MFSHVSLHALLGCAGFPRIRLIAPSALMAPAGMPISSWLRANGHGVVAIAQCGEALSGRIVGVDRALSKPMPADVTGHSQFGLTAITNERLHADGLWLCDMTDGMRPGVNLDGGE